MLVQESVAQVGTLPAPITGPTPTSVDGQADLLQADNGPLTDSTYLTRGYIPFAGPVTVMARLHSWRSSLLCETWPASTRTASVSVH